LAKRCTAASSSSLFAVAVAASPDASAGQHEEVKALAAAIIKAQQREIAIMEKHASGEDHG
jgi:uncharacterized protein (DUF305 family)